MVSNKPEQRLKRNEVLSAFIIMHLNRLGWNCARLASESRLSKTTITRMVTGIDHLGRPYCASLNQILALILAFKLNDDEIKELFLAAAPQISICLEARDNKLSVDKVDDRLYNEGLPILSKTK